MCADMTGAVASTPGCVRPLGTKWVRRRRARADARFARPMREADTSHPGRSDVVDCGPGLDRIE